MAPAAPMPATHRKPCGAAGSRSASASASSSATTAAVTAALQRADGPFARLVSVAPARRLVSCSLRGPRRRSALGGVVGRPHAPVLPRCCCGVNAVLLRHQADARAVAIVSIDDAVEYLLQILYRSEIPVLRSN